MLYMCLTRYSRVLFKEKRNKLGVNTFFSVGNSLPNYIITFYWIFHWQPGLKIHKGT